MATLLFDIESDGLLDEVTKVHIIVVKDLDTGKVEVYNTQQGNVVEGVTRLMGKGHILVGHNILSYDIPALKKLYPRLVPNFNKLNIHDTLVMAKLVWPDLYPVDTKLRESGVDIPNDVFCRHSLAAFGYRLGCLKANYKGGWEHWSQEMQDYCIQDVQVNHKLYQMLLKKNTAPEALSLEHNVRRIVDRQERYGVVFDIASANKLYLDLCRDKFTAENELKTVVKPWFSKGELTEPKVSNSKTGTTKGSPYTKVKLIEFNPGSRDHISNRLMTLYGWKPSKDGYGDNGKPTVDESVLKSIRKYPIVPLLEKYLLLNKRIGQLAEGNNAWLKLYDSKTGRIHGRVDTNGTVTGRMTHAKPNMAQVPSCGSPYGTECRSLFTVPPGKVMVGVDASGLELRCLAHYMAAYDGGAYVDVVLNGDIHWMTVQALYDMADVVRDKHNDDHNKKRDLAKRFIYAFLYGAGDAKIGEVMGVSPRKGKELKEQFLKGLPALGKLIQAVKKKAKGGYIVGLDGRHIPVRSEHSALNTLLQGAGACLMKRALVILDDSLQNIGLVPSVDYEFILNIHDEFQIEVSNKHEEVVKKVAVQSIQEAGAYYKFRCPLDGEAKSGRTWADTH